jgi:hypothetical protein
MFHWGSRVEQYGIYRLGSKTVSRKTFHELYNATTDLMFNYSQRKTQ